MGYKVKWVEENLGITRKTLRVFEDHGLMPKNEEGQYRDYSEEDINRIWSIRVLQGIGYSLKEIADMKEDENCDFMDSLEEKIKELEDEMKKLEQHLGYAKTIKLTGRFPHHPKVWGSITFNDFKEKSLSEWNMMDEPKTKECQEIAELILTRPQEEWQNTDIGRMLLLLESISNVDPDVILSECILPRAIIKRMELGAAHAEIQLLMKMIYENQVALLPDIKDMSQQQFARFYSSSYIAGDFARIKEKDFGREACEFVAEAAAIFGGFDSYESLLEEERLV